MKPESYHCIEDYKTPYPHSIVFYKGEKVLVGEKYKQNPAWQGWIRCKGTEDRIAWIPEEYLQIKGTHGKLTREYDAKELNLNKGEILTIAKIINGFGIAINQNGDLGWVPMNHLESISFEA